MPPLEDDSEKILTIEQAEVDQGEQEQINPQDNQTEEDNNNQNQAEDQPQQPQTKGQKISKDMHYEHFWFQKWGFLHSPNCCYLYFNDFPSSAYLVLCTLKNHQM